METEGLGQQGALDVLLRLYLSVHTAIERTDCDVYLRVKDGAGFVRVSILR